MLAQRWYKISPDSTFCQQTMLSVRNASLCPHNAYEHCYEIYDIGTGKNLNNFPCITGYSSMNDVKKIRDLKSHAWAP
jgi:hypothetical protein